MRRWACHSAVFMSHLSNASWMKSKPEFYLGWSVKGERWGRGLSKRDPFCWSWVLFYSNLPSKSLLDAHLKIHSSTTLEPSHLKRLWFPSPGSAEASWSWWSCELFLDIPQTCRLSLFLLMSSINFGLTKCCSMSSFCKFIENVLV